jgi:nucleotide-binding universal stress UspA family protein
MAAMKARPSSGPPRTGLGRVLLATDFSPGANAALSRLARLALMPRAEVVLLHVLPRRLTPVDSLLLEAAREQLARTRDRLQASFAARGRTDVTVRGRLARGNPAGEIGRVAQETRSELVILGRRGAGRLGRLLVGSTARRVIRLGRCPVLAVARAGVEPYRRIVIGFDLSPPALGALRLAARLSDPPRTRVVVVNAVEDPYEGLPTALIPPTSHQRLVARGRALRKRAQAIRRIVERVSVRPESWRMVFRARDPRQVILAEAAAKHTDMIALGSTSKSGIPRFLIGSVVEHVLDRARTDILVVPRPS